MWPLFFVKRDILASQSISLSLIFSTCKNVTAWCCSPSHPWDHWVQMKSPGNYPQYPQAVTRWNLFDILGPRFPQDLGCSVQFSSVQSLSRVWLFATPWIAARQASLSITNSRSSPRLTSESVMPSSHLILCRPLLLLPPIPPSIRVFYTGIQ